jgi:hypothetical protein
MTFRLGEGVDEIGTLVTMISSERSSAPRMPRVRMRVFSALVKSGFRKGVWLALSRVRFGSCVTNAPLRAAVRNCARDEGGPFEAGSQVQVSSHRELLSSRAMVASVAETSGHDPGRQG